VGGVKAARLLTAGVAVAAVVAGGVVFAVRHSDRASSVLARFTDQGVTVTLKAKDRNGPRTTVEATFVPQRPGFHLYSVDLPADGVGGVGRPTKVTAQGALRATGTLTAEAGPLMMPLTGTDLTLSVYPDGPVTTDLLVDNAGSGAATLLVSYAACSPTACLPPVTDHRVDLQVTASGVTS
jgi:hypothetical protein